MEYSDTQIAAADLILKTLLEHESFVNDYEILAMVKKRYGIKATFVIDMLKDDGLIAQHGEAFLKLTSKGGKAAKYGMKWHQRKLDIKDQAKIAGWLIGVVASITAILSFIIGLLC